MSKRPILVTGFDAFGDRQTNPSEELARQFSNRRDVHVDILPTSYARASERIKQLISEFKPKAVLMLGYTKRTDRLRLELYAHNRDKAVTRDNDGHLGAEFIVPGGLPVLPSTAAVQDLAKHLHDARFAVNISQNAGNYVCNHIYFVALHDLRRKGETPCVFVHVPAWESQQQHSDLLHGLNEIVDWLASGGHEPSPAATAPWA